MLIGSFLTGAVVRQEAVAAVVLPQAALLCADGDVGRPRGVHP